MIKLDMYKNQDSSLLFMDSKKATASVKEYVRGNRDAAAKTRLTPRRCTLPTPFLIDLESIYNRVKEITVTTLEYDEQEIRHFPSQKYCGIHNAEFMFSYLLKSLKNAANLYLNCIKMQ
eukprot:snap_masked-scaffold_20-processed-gene-5.62-mRNA-1 protein AED:1.00 eAED:1.00 QI:0/0/0/0/1/1/2/0/118